MPPPRGPRLPAALIALALTLVAGPALADDAGPQAGARAPATTLDHVQARGTHNSYKLDPRWPGREAFGWDYQHRRLARQLEEQDVRQVELDVHYNWARDEFEVYHAWLGDDRTSCRLLTDCLEELRGWSDLRPDHHPLMILVEPKDGGPPRNAELPEDGDPFTHPIGEAEYAKLDEVLLAAFDGPAAEGGRVLTPDDLTVAGSTLRDSILEHGWPRVDDLRGRVLYVIDGRASVDERPSASEHGYDYSRGWTSLGGRAAFVQAEPFHDVAGFVSRDGQRLDGEGKYDRIRRVVSEGFLVRDLVAPDGFEVAKQAGVHFISSDFPEELQLSRHPHAPSRCNPVTADAACRDPWLERRAGDDIDLPDEPSDERLELLADQVDRLALRSVGSGVSFAERAVDDPSLVVDAAGRQLEVWRDFVAWGAGR
jgi:hypothetical protein